MAADFSKLSFRYARALLRAVETTLGKSGATTPAQMIAVTLQQFVHTLESTPLFQDSLVNPMFSKEERERALMSALELFSPQPLLAEFIRVCFEKERIAIIDQIAKAFAQLADEAAGIVEVVVTTARDIDLFERSKVEMMVKEKVAGTPKFIWKHDKELLGGMVIRMGDRVIDSSVSARLDRFKSLLLQSAV